MWELLGDRMFLIIGDRMFLIIGHVIIEYANSSSDLTIGSRMVPNWQLHCRDFENLEFAKYLTDCSIPLADFENLDDSK